MSSSVRSGHEEMSGGSKTATTGVVDRAVATSARAFQKPTASAKEFRSDTQIPAGTGGAKVLPTAPSR